MKEAEELYGESITDYKTRLGLDDLKPGDELVFVKDSVGMPAGSIVTFHSWAGPDNVFYYKMWNGSRFFKSVEYFFNFPDHDFDIGAVKKLNYVQED